MKNQKKGRSRFNINPEKILKEEDLKNLKGGDYPRWDCIVRCQGYSEDHFGFSTAYPEQWYAEMSCIVFFSQQFTGCNCVC